MYKEILEFHRDGLVWRYITKDDMYHSFEPVGLHKINLEESGREIKTSALGTDYIEYPKYKAPPFDAA